MNLHALLPLALDLLAKSSGILLLAFSVNSLWRNASAAQRCLVWGAAFTVLLLLPLTLLVPPRWSFAWERPQPAPDLPAAVLHFEDAPVSSERVAVEPVVVARQLPRLSAPQMAVGFWIAGALLVLGRRVLGAWQVRCLRLRSHALEDARVSAFATDLAQESGVRRRIELRDSTQVSVPMTWGVFGPVLLLPHQALSWGDAPMKAALRHEIGHIRHCDALTRLAACVVCAAFWPNVLVWLAAKAWRTAQEQACDDLVLRAGATRQDYAMQLLDAARGMKADAFRRAPVMAMARPSTLETRLAAIMDDSRDRRPLRGSAWLAGGGAALALLAVCTTLQLQAEDKTVTKSAPDNKDAPVIQISTKIIELSNGAPTARSMVNALVPQPGETALMSDQEAEEFTTELNNKKGINLLSAPTVTTRSGQQASIEIGREFATPDATPREQKVGVFLTLLPRLEGKNGVKLSVEGMVREFEGFRDDPASGKKQPVFRELKTKADLDMRSGTTAAMVSKMSPDEKREILYLISVKVVSQADALPVNNHGAATITPDGKTRTVTDSSPILSIFSTAWMKNYEKTSKIILPRVEFRNATLEEALDFLRVKSRELDPAKEGLDFVLVDRPADDKRVSLALSDVPINKALDRVTELTGMRYSFAETAVTIISIERWKEEHKNNLAEIERVLSQQKKSKEEFLEKYSAAMKKDGSQKATDATKNTGNSPGDLYFIGYLSWKAGEKLEQEGNKEGALQKYLEAHKSIQAVRNEYPDWQPAVVNYRLKKLAEALSSLGYTER